MDRIVVIGANGQVGQELKQTPISNLGDVSFWGRSEFDLTNDSHFEKLFELNPTWIINVGAYTNVDLAEDEPDLAFSINADAVKKLAKTAKAINATLIHISSDYVYDNGLERPLLETDECQPKGVYAKSKHLGDVSIQAIMTNYYIIRTSWVYSTFGHNFVKTMLRLSQKYDEINVVNDQIGSPTYARDLAALIPILIMSKPEFGIYNFCNKEICSWNEFARIIFELKRVDMKINPISTYDYGAKAPRPKYSVLNCDKLDVVLGKSMERRNWKTALTEILRNL